MNSEHVAEGCWIKTAVIEMKCLRRENYCLIYGFPSSQSFGSIFARGQLNLCSAMIFELHVELPPDNKTQTLLKKSWPNLHQLGEQTAPRGLVVLPGFGLSSRGYYVLWE